MPKTVKIHEYSELVASAKQLYPERFKNPSERFSENLRTASLLFDMVQQKLEGGLSSTLNLELATNGKIIYPEKDFEKLFMDSDISSLTASINELKSQMVTGPTSNQKPLPKAYIAQIVSHYKFLFPEHAHRVNFTHTEWGKLKEQIDQYRSSSKYKHLGPFCASLKIATADKIAITEDGQFILSYNDNKKLKSSASPFPETKKF